jgi:hypothetical protein
VRTGEKGAAQHLGADRQRPLLVRPGRVTGANQDSYYSGEHHRHGVNLQGLVGLDGRVLCLGEAR